LNQITPNRYAKDTIMASWEFPGSDPIEMYISLPSGSIAISAEPTDKTTVRLEPSRPGRHSDDLISEIRVEFSDGRLEITFPRQFGMRRNGSVDLTVRAPARSSCTVHTASSDISCLGELAALDGKTGSGDLTAAVVSGPVQLETASGDLWLEEAAGAARLHSASGDVRLLRAGGDVIANSASGDLAIGTAAGSVTARTASGDLRVDRIVTGQADLNSVSGDITVGVAPGTGVYLDLSTVSGRVRSDLEESADDGTGALVLKCRTVSGDVEVVRAAPVPAETAAPRPGSSDNNATN
jgi:DUF4097 and DUF4098 domain-containing protein YvlB